MKLQELLKSKRSKIVKKWFDMILDTYPKDSRDLFRKTKHRFTNPVGSNIFEGINSIFDILLEKSSNGDKRGIPEYLDNIVRIRAVQDFSPSEAIEFVLFLKKIIRKELNTDLKGNAKLNSELFEFETKIDEVLLESFNIFMKCREKLYELKANEMKNRTANLIKLMERANILYQVDNDNLEQSSPDGTTDQT